MNYKHVLSVQLKDGVVTPEVEVWIHWVDAPPKQEVAKFYWNLLVEDPSWFSVGKPEYTISEDGATIYKD